MERGSDHDKGGEHVALHISLGQSTRDRTVVHALDPRLKVVATIGYMASCLFVCDLPTALTATAALGLAAAAARTPLRRLGRQARNLAVFLVVTSLINLIATQTGPVVLEAGPLQIHHDGIRLAALYVVRFLLLLLGGSLLLQTTTPLSITDALGRLLSPLARLGVPVDHAMVVLSVALQFVPTLSRDAETIVKAQKARGAQLEKAGLLGYARACIPLIVPLFSGALRHAESLGCAMDARCYTGSGRTHLHVMRLDPQKDGIACALCLLYAVAFLIARLIL